MCITPVNKIELIDVQNKQREPVFPNRWTTCSYPGFGTSNDPSYLIGSRIEKNELTTPEQFDEFTKDYPTYKLIHGGGSSMSTALQTAMYCNHIALAKHIAQKGGEIVVNLMGAGHQTPLITLAWVWQDYDSEEGRSLADVLMKEQSQVNIGIVGMRPRRPSYSYSEIETPLSTIITNNYIDKHTNRSYELAICEKIIGTDFFDNESKQPIRNFLVEVKHRKENTIIFLLKNSEFFKLLPEDIMGKITMSCFPQLDNAITHLYSAKVCSHKTSTEIVDSINRFKEIQSRNDTLVKFFLDNGAIVYPGIIHGVNQSLARLSIATDTYKSQYLEKDEKIIIWEDTSQRHINEAPPPSKSFFQKLFSLF